MPHSVHGAEPLAIRSGEPSSAPSSTYSSGTAATASSRRPARNSSWMRLGRVARSRGAPSRPCGSSCRARPCRRRRARRAASSRRSCAATSSVRCTVVDDVDLRASSSERPDRAAPFSSAGAELVRVGGGEAHRDPAVGDLGRERDVLRTAGRDDRSGGRGSGAGSTCSGLPSPVASAPAYGSEIAATVVRDRAFAPEHLAHDRDVVARARDRLRPRLAVPAFDDLRPRQARAPRSPARGPRALRSSRTPSRSRPVCAPRSARLRSRA